jgi:hypothetical protein
MIFEIIFQMNLRKLNLFILPPDFFHLTKLIFVKKKNTFYFITIGRKY